MKKSLAKAIALAATLGAAASAQAAISLNHNGQGQVLLYPLYTVENGNDTAISVTNTTDEFKVVKVRFREALNSQDVLDFHLFLSPKDVWNGVVVPTEDGAKLFTRDTSCTVPSIPADGQPFTNLAYTGGAVETVKRGEDGGPQGLNRTRVGYAEIIELGVLDPYALTSTDKAGAPAGTKVSFYEAIKHVNGVPGNCGAIVNEYLTGNWKDGSGATTGGNTQASTGYSYGFKAPGVTNQALPAGLTTAGGYTNAAFGAATLGGLYGVGTITNVFAGQQIGYDATALGGFIDESVNPAVTATPANLHNATGYSFPDLNGNRTAGTAVTAPLAGISASKNATINGVTYTFAKTIDAVSAVLQRTQLNNEFSIDAAVGAGTDWVINFPTKHHYVWDSQIAADGRRTSFDAAGNPGAHPTNPLLSVVDTPVNQPAAHTNPAYAFVGANSAVAPIAGASANVAPFQLSSLWKGVAGNAKAEVPVTLGYTDREEKVTTAIPSISFSPRPVTPGVNYALSYEANVLTFNKSNVLVAEDSAARYNWNVDTSYKSGWATIGLLTNAASNRVVSVAPVAPATGVAATAFVGLPTLGFATIKVTNGDLGGVLSNYNAAWNHKSN